MWTERPLGASLMARSFIMYENFCSSFFSGVWDCAPVWTSEVVKSKHMPEPVLEATESTNAAIQVAGKQFTRSHDVKHR